MSCSFRVLIFHDLVGYIDFILSCMILSTSQHLIHEPTHIYEVLLRCLALC